MKSLSQSSSQNWLIIFSLIFAGEMIFSLPFHVPRFFRPTLLEVFQLSNTGLGDAFAVYGITAMLSYFPGGVIADYFSARRLMTFSLVGTAAGGVYFANIPEGHNLYFLYGYWGITSIFLFWAGMIKATRDWGREYQGRAFGLLDGGRGLVAALVSSLAVVIFADILQEEAAAGVAQKAEALGSVIYLYTVSTLIAAIAIWFFIPEKAPSLSKEKPWNNATAALKMPQVWLISLIVICAYCGFKGLDNYGLYAVEVLGMDRVEAATLSSFGAYLRPVGAIGAGLLADRFGGSHTIKWCFGFMVLVYAGWAFLWPKEILMLLAMANMAISFLAVYGLRGVYFALVDESRVMPHLTGTAVGVISLVGYTPDVFFGAVTGRILDASPGESGFQNYFIFLTGVSVLGLITAVLLRRKNI